MANERGQRIIFDTKTGRIYYESGEIDHSPVPMPHPVIEGLEYIDYPYGKVDFNKYQIIKIDPVTKEPILEKYPWIIDEDEAPTQQEVIVKYEEDLELLKANEELGGLI